MTSVYLVLFDADHIKSYVFATGRLKEVRGASEQVRRLTEYKATGEMPRLFKQYDLKPWAPGDASQTGIIYASGGAGAIVFATEDKAKRFCEDLEREFRRQTGGATLSAVWQEVQYEDSAKEKRIAAEFKAQSTAARKLARRKASRPHTEGIVGGSLVRFCASDRLRPASVSVRESEGDGLLASYSTANKHKKNQLYRSDAQYMQTPFWKAFEERLPKEHVSEWQAAIDASQDLHEISAYARPSGYVALVYADGDGIGTKMRGIVENHGFRGLQAFSTALADGANNALAEALAKAYGDHAPYNIAFHDAKQNSPALPFEVVTVGGDDIILICTAEHGLAIACSLADRFGHYVNASLKGSAPTMVLDPAPTMSVGVVIAHDSLPIVQLERRGRELLKSAKKVSGDTHAGIDFHIVSTPALDNIAALRARDYGIGDDTGLTRRPYPFVGMQTLLQSARFLRGLSPLDDSQRTDGATQEPATSAPPLIPTSKRADLYNACFNERVQATLDVLAVHMRLKATEREALLKVLERLESIQFYPFKRYDDKPHYRTALIDILEAMEFVAEEGKWHRTERSS